MSLPHAPQQLRPLPNDPCQHMGQNLPPTWRQHETNYNAAEHTPTSAPPLACPVYATHISTVVHNILRVAPAKVVGTETLGTLHPSQMQQRSEVGVQRLLGNMSERPASQWKGPARTLKYEQRTTLCKGGRAPKVWRQHVNWARTPAAMAPTAPSKPAAGTKARAKRKQR